MVKFAENKIKQIELRKKRLESNIKSPAKILKLKRRNKMEKNLEQKIGSFEGLQNCLRQARTYLMAAALGISSIASGVSSCAEKELSPCCKEKECYAQMGHICDCVDTKGCTSDKNDVTKCCSCHCYRDR